MGGPYRKEYYPCGFYSQRQTRQMEELERNVKEETIKHKRNVKEETIKHKRNLKEEEYEIKETTYQNPFLC